jgi:5-methylcytosine-specific restriction endonuclease McrA
MLGEAAADDVAVGRLVAYNAVMNTNTRKCLACGTGIPKPASSKVRHKLYCSPACLSARRTQGWGRKPQGQAANCLVCGGLFYTPPGRPGRYCSRPCYAKGRWGEAHVTTRDCVICKTPFLARISDYKTCCGPACRSQRRSEANRGERCHFWRGGAAAPYNEEWQFIRKQALARDGKACVLCGSKNRVNVHHVVPYRYSQSHALTNLITLCRSCHSREELKVNPAFAAALFGQKEAHGPQVSS